MTDVGQLMKRSIEVTANTAGNTGSPTVTALLASAAVVTRNPELAWLALPAGAFAGALTETGIAIAGQTIQDRRDRVQRLADSIAKEAGEPFDDFMAEHATSEEQRDLLGHVVAAATDSASAWKIRILARAFVQGVRADGAVDGTLRHINLLSRLDATDGRFLAAHSLPRT